MVSSNSNGNYLPSGFLVGHGKCTRDSMRPRIWCEAVPHVGGLHAALILGYPHYNVCLPAAHLFVCEPPPSVTKLGQEELHACWEIFIVHDLPALRIRIQFSDTKALAGQSKIMKSGHSVPYILKLAFDGSLQVGSRGCSCLTQLGLVDCGAWVVCLYCYGMLHWCLEWLQLGGFQGLGTLCQALYRFSYHDMLLDLDSLWSHD